jgi:processive 1,2-diacylglycerol beta-glucosyltransferase
MICYSDAGNGPITSSTVIAESIKELVKDDVSITVVDVLKKTTQLGFLVVKLYNYLLSKNLLWNTLGLSIFYRSKLVQTGTLLNFSLKKLIDLLNMEDPSIIIFTNPWIIGYVIKASQKTNFKPKMVSLIIDIGENIPPSWYHSDIDLFIAPTEEVKRELQRYGASNHKIKVLGMPISKRLLELSNNNNNNNYNNLDKNICKDKECKNKNHVLIIGGRSGTKNTFEIVKYLIKENIAMHLIILCGYNEKLKNKIKDYLQKSNYLKKEIDPKKITVLGFVPDIYSFMITSDIIITKPGALTIAESIIIGIPLILDIFPVVMGQEIGNVKYVETNGLGLIARKPKDVPVLIKKILFDPYLKNNMLIRLKNAKKLYGTGDISRVILELENVKVYNNTDNNNINNSNNLNQI